MAIRDHHKPKRHFPALFQRQNYDQWLFFCSYVLLLGQTKGLVPVSQQQATTSEYAGTQLVIRCITNYYNKKFVKLSMHVEIICCKSLLSFIENLLASWISTKGNLNSQLAKGARKYVHLGHINLEKFTAPKKLLPCFLLLSDGLILSSVSFFFSPGGCYV